MFTFRPTVLAAPLLMVLGSAGVAGGPNLGQPASPEDIALYRGYDSCGGSGCAPRLIRRSDWPNATETAVCFGEFAPSSIRVRR